MPRRTVFELGPDNMPILAPRRGAGRLECGSPLAREIGARMSQARFIAGHEPDEAADGLGLKDAAAVLAVEAGITVPTLGVIVAAAGFYGTTTDYLCGLVEDSDRDPAAMLHRHAAAQMVATASRMVAALSASAAESVRELVPDARLVAAMACRVVDVHAATDALLAAEPEVRNVPGFEAVLIAVERAGHAARAHLESLARARRRSALRDLDVAALARVDAGHLPLPTASGAAPQPAR